MGGAARVQTFVNISGLCGVGGVMVPPAPLPNKLLCILRHTSGHQLKPRSTVGSVHLFVWFQMSWARSMLFNITVSSANPPAQNVRFSEKSLSEPSEHQLSFLQTSSVYCLERST